MNTCIHGFQKQEVYELGSIAALHIFQRLHNPTAITRQEVLLALRCVFEVLLVPTLSLANNDFESSTDKGLQHLQLVLSPISLLLACYIDTMNMPNSKSKNTHISSTSHL